MENQYLKKIIAQSPEDLNIISACCSEGKVNIRDVKYLASNKIFLISISRFSKEEEYKNKLIKIILFLLVYYIKTSISNHNTELKPLLKLVLLQ